MIISSIASMCQRYLDCDCHIVSFLSLAPPNYLILTSFYQIQVVTAVWFFLFLDPPKRISSAPTMIRFLMDANLQGTMHLLIPHWSKL